MSYLSALQVFTTRRYTNARLLTYLLTYLFTLLPEIKVMYVCMYDMYICVYVLWCSDETQLFPQSCPDIVLQLVWLVAPGGPWTFYLGHL